MPISISSNSLAVPVNRSFNEVRNSNVSIVDLNTTNARQKDNQVQIQQVNTLRTNDSQSSNARKRGETFVLTPQQSENLDRLTGNSRRDNGSQQNLLVGQYLETESFERREEIESLVGVDLFV